MTNLNESSDDSDEDQEALERLREAVNFETLREHPSSAKIISECDPLPEISGGKADEQNDSSLKDDVNSISDNIKEKIKHSLKASKRSQNVKPTQLQVKSLRRDKQESEYKSAVISELEVTPQFQKFVGKKLDEFLDDQIEDIDATSKVISGDSKISNLKLLKRSSSLVKDVDVDANIKRSKPDLLAHTKIQTSDEDLVSCAVSGDFVLSQVDTKSWVNKFPNRVEPGIERIKKKKKKVKKKKKKKKPASDIKEVKTTGESTSESES